MGRIKRSRGIAVVVDDDDLQREMIALLLEECEFEVVQCENAEAALSIIKTQHPTFLITDVNVNGGMDGITLAHLAGHQNPRLRIVVISGNPLTNPLPEGVKFYSKPVSPMTLLREAIRSGDSRIVTNST